MLGHRAITAFLARERSDFTVYKSLSDQRLDRIAAKYHFEQTLWRQLKRHQKVMVAIGLRMRRFAYHADTGTGKTLVSLALTKHLRKHGQIKRVLVLIPRSANKFEWENEIRKHTPDLSYVLLPSNIQQKWRALESDATIAVETYAGITVAVCERAPGKQGKNRFKPSKKLVKKLCDQFDMIVLDESHCVKNRAKLPFRICRKLAQHAGYFFELSATPHGRNPEDLWAQLFLIDRGATLGESLGLFRSVFFKERMNIWGGTDYEFRKDREELLNKILHNRSIRIPADQADLPKMVSIIKHVSLPEEAVVYYQRARQMMLRGANFREMKNGWLRMRQISSGFVGFHDDDAGKTAEYEFPENPKLDLLLSLIEGIDPRWKIIVYVEFTYSGLRIMRELKDLGIGALHLHGGTSKTKELLQAFNHDASKRVLVLQNAFGIGLNLQVAKYGLTYEAPVSPITRHQCIRRFERQGSPHNKVFLYDLVTTGTVDAQILEFLKEGKDLFRAIIEGHGREVSIRRMAS